MLLVSAQWEVAVFASTLQPHVLEGTSREEEEEPQLRTGLIEAQLELKRSWYGRVLVEGIEVSAPRTSS